MLDDNRQLLYRMPASVLSKRLPLGRLATNAGWIYLGYGFDLLIGFLLVGYVVRHVAMAEYGLLLLAFSVSGFLLLFDFGLSSVLIVGLAGVRADRERWGRMVSTAFFFSCALGSLALLTCLGLAAWLPGPFKVPLNLRSLARALFICAGVLALQALPIKMLEVAHQSVQRFDRLARYQLWLSCLRAVATIGALELGHGVLALALIQVAVSGLRLAGLWRSLHRLDMEVQIGFRQWDWALFRPVLRMSGWSALDNFSRQLGIGNDSLVLGIFSSMPVVAVYGIGSKLPSQLPALMSQGLVATAPACSEYGQQNDRARLRELYVAVTTIALAVALPAALVLFALAGTIIRLWAGPGYVASATVMRWLLVGVPGFAIFSAAGTVLYATARIRTAGLISLMEAVANLCLSVALVFRYGAAGVAAASAVTHVAATLFWYVPAACRAVGMSGWRLLADVMRPIALPLASATAVLGVLFLIPDSMAIARLAVGALALAAYGATWLATGVAPSAVLAVMSRSRVQL